MSSIEKKLSPLQAARIAAGAYNLNSGHSLEKILDDAELANHFKFTNYDSSPFKGTTGAFKFKAETGFGLIAMGKDKFKGHALLACRGTAGGQDMLTDVNIGIQ